MPTNPLEFFKRVMDHIAVFKNALKELDNVFKLSLGARANYHDIMHKLRQRDEAVRVVAEERTTHGTN